MSLGAISALKHPAFRRMWLASVATIQSNMMILVAASWLMTTLTTSPILIALVQASITAPVMLFSLFTGVLADSFDRRRLMQIAQSFMLTIAAILAILEGSGALSPALLLVLTFLMGSGSSINNPSWQASIGDLVPREEIPSAIALNNIANNLARCLGPAVSGVLLVVWPIWATIAIGAVGFTLMISVLARWKPQRPDQQLPREGFGSALVTGLRYASLVPGVLSTIARATLFAFGSIFILSLLPVVVRALPGGNAMAYGSLLSTFGLGALGGALASRFLYGRLGGEGLVRLAFITMGIACTCMALSDKLWLIALALPFAGAAWVSGFTTFNSTVQLSTARWVVGRMMSIHQMGLFSGLTLGSFTAGILATNMGIKSALLAAGGFLIIGALAGLLRQIPETGHTDLDPLSRFSAPEPRLPLINRSGPILITITYQVPEEETDHFLSAIATRSQSRRRDGARQWALHQDIGDPQIWTESYQVSSWAEYQRHNLRQTRGDQENLDDLRRFHAPEPNKIVRRMLQRTPYKSTDGTPTIV